MLEHRSCHTLLGYHEGNRVLFSWGYIRRWTYPSAQPGSKYLQVKSVFHTTNWPFQYMPIKANMYRRPLWWYLYWLKLVGWPFNLNTLSWITCQYLSLWKSLKVLLTLPLQMKIKEDADSKLVMRWPIQRKRDWPCGLGTENGRWETKRWLQSMF